MDIKKPLSRFYQSTAAAVVTTFVEDKFVVGRMLYELTW
jgi:hypothetical protein